MFHYVYKTTNLIDGRYYIGCHTARTMDNAYLGSGTYLKRTINKYGCGNFRKEILCVCKDAQEKFAVEKQMVTEEVLRDPLCMNLYPGGQGGNRPGEHASFFGRRHKPQTIEKMMVKSRGRRLTPEALEKISQNHADVSGVNNPMHGKRGIANPLFGSKRPDVAERNRLRKGEKRGPQSLKTRIKKSNARKGKSSFMAGKRHTVEAKERIREACKRAAQTFNRGSDGRFIAKAQGAAV